MSILGSEVEVLLGLGVTVAGIVLLAKATQCICIAGQGPGCNNPQCKAGGGGSSGGSGAGASGSGPGINGGAPAEPSQNGLTYLFPAASGQGQVGWCKGAMSWIYWDSVQNQYWWWSSRVVPGYGDPNSDGNISGAQPMSANDIVSLCGGS